MRYNTNLPNSQLKLIAVQLKNVSFSYGPSWKQFYNKHLSDSKAALTECCIDVPHGQIYALLGPSGCGKTTLIRCILRRIQPKSGVIRVFGDETKSCYRMIGNMAQELGLLNEFTIEETFFYFGQLHHMTTDTIKERLNFFMKFFNLPQKKRLVCELSGGQQRLVSLSVALIHSPQLLILDEPTVGVDSLIRRQVWDYLDTLCKHNSVTVIITTHYIEEASNANMVALMRDGRILEQESPKRLMQKYDCNTLEETFLKVCEQNDSGKKIPDEPKESNTIQCFSSATESNHDNNNFMTTIFFNLMIIWVVMKKNLLILRQNPIPLSVYFMIPLFQYAVTFAMFRDGYYPLQVAVVNYEDPPVLSKNILNSFKSLTQIPHKNLNEAIDSVKYGPSVAVISISSNFSESLQERIFDGFRADNDSIIGSNIALYMDMSNIFHIFFTFKQILTSIEEFFQKHLNSLQLNPNSISMPLQLNEVIYGKIEPNIPHTFASAMILFMVFFIEMCTASALFLKDKNGAQFERSLICGANSLHFLIAHFLLNCILLNFQIVWALFINFIIFDLQNLGNVWLVIISIYAQGINGIVVGLLFSSLVNDFVFICIIWLATFLMGLTIVGLFWPIESKPYILKICTYFFPLTLPIRSFRSILFRGWGINHMQVMMGFILNFVYIIIGSVLCIGIALYTN